MKTINVARKNSRELIDAVLNDIQRRCKVRIITSDDIINQLIKYETSINISKKALNGTKVTMDINAQSFPNAYKFIPESTKFSVEYINGSWRITDIYRGICTKTKILATLSDSAKIAVINNYERQSV